MESIPLTEAIKRVWDAMMELGVPLAAAVSEVFKSFSDYSPADIEDALFSIVGKEKWREASKGVPVTTYDSDSPFYECSNVDSRGRVLDIMTQSEIPAERLISYFSGGRKYCFDMRSLKEYIQRSEGGALNPLTREPFPESVIEDVMRYEEGARKVLFNGEYVAYEEYMTYGDLILYVLGKRGNILESLLEYDVDGDGVSLYSESLSEKVRDSLRRIELGEFLSKTNRDAKLLSMFRYTKGLGTRLAESVSLFLGAILRLIPVVADTEVVISENDTVGDVLIKILSVYGYDKWGTLDMMYEGVSLHDFDYDDLIIDVAPDVTLNVVLANFSEEELEEIRQNLVSYASENDFWGLVHAMGYATSKGLLENINNVRDAEVVLDTLYLVDDIDEYALLLMDRVLQQPTSFDTMKAIYEAFKSWRKGDTITKIVLAYGLKRVNEGIDWEGYVGLVRGDMNNHTGSTTLSDLARGYITGNLPAEISHVDVAALGSSELLSYLLNTGKITMDDAKRIVSIARSIGTAGSRRLEGSILSEWS